jgi:hypothetical protein
MTRKEHDLTALAIDPLGGSANTGVAIRLLTPRQHFAKHTRLDGRRHVG